MVCGYFSELTNMVILPKRLENLARLMGPHLWDQSFKESDQNKNMGDEMADILWVLLCLANQTGIDLNEAFRKNLEKKTIRDKERHKNKSKTIRYGQISGGI